MRAASPQDYHLVIVMGATPAVLTETIWSLARQHDPPRHPVSVDVLTTEVGRAVLEARLQGRPRFHPVDGRPLEARDRWRPFCDDVLAGARPPLRVHVPRRSDGAPLPDIRNAEDDARFAELCYRRVARLTEDPDGPPVVGSLAGGRKTMSAHLMTAFILFARPEDRLVHVLVNPPALENDPAFFYPAAGHDGAARLDRVDLAFPHLRPYVPDRKAVLADPARYIREHLTVPSLPVRPERVRCRLAPRAAGGCRLELCADGGTVAAVPLRPADAATFLVLAEALLERNGPVANTTLVKNAGVEARRRAVVRRAGRYEPLTPWTTTDDLSKHLSRLGKRLRTHPVMAHHLLPTATYGREATCYALPGGLPPLEVLVEREDPEAPWPFSHIPRPGTSHAPRAR